MALWTKDGKLVVDGAGKPIDCDACPCRCPGTLNAEFSITSSGGNEGYTLTIDLGSVNTDALAANSNRAGTWTITRDPYPALSGPLTVYISCDPVTGNLWASVDTEEYMDEAGANASIAFGPGAMGETIAGTAGATGWGFTLSGTVTITKA